MRAFARTMLVFGGFCVTAGGARAQSMDIPLNLVLMGSNDPGVHLTINIGIDGQAPRPYLFDTGSEVFVAKYTAAAFGSVPESQASLPQGLGIAYGTGAQKYFYNLVGTPSLTFYSSSTATSGGITLNAITPSGAPSQFEIGAVTREVMDSFPDGKLNGGFTGDYGVFGAGNFLKSGPGSPLGQAVIPGTTAGYVVAANGQPLSAMESGPVNVSSPNGPQVGQSVTSCSPCVMLGLTPALIAQFKPANTLATQSSPADGTFANSNAPATIEAPYFWNYSVTPAGGGATVTVSSRTLLDTGTMFYQIDSAIPSSDYANGGATLTVSGPASGATQSSVVLIANSEGGNLPNPYFAAPTPIESVLGIGFFLTNSVLYNLAGSAVGYTSNFVTDVNITTTSSSPLVIDSSSVPLGLAGVISGSGPVEVVNGGSATLSGTNSYTGATIVNNNGFLALVGPGSISLSSGVSVSSGGIFDISGVGSGSPTGAFITSLSSSDNAGVVQLGSNQLVLTNANGTFAGSIQDGGSYGGTGGSLVLAGGVEILTGVNTYTGGTIVLGGTLQVSGAGTLGAPTGSATLWGGVLDLGHTTQTLAALFLMGGTVQDGALNAPIVSSGGAINGISGHASLTTVAGATYVLGANTYTGGTNVNGGVLDVIGSLSDPTVNAGGALMGTGTVGATQVKAGGILAPGNGLPGTMLTIAGNLAFQSGAIYFVQLNPSTTSFATVTGTAALAGTVQANLWSGTYVIRQYDILRAAGLSGAFSGVTSNLPGFDMSLNYGATDVALNLHAALGLGAGLGANQQTIATTINNFFNSGGALPSAFLSLFAQTGAGLPNALTQVSGELATGAQQTTFNAMGEFINLLTDPFMGRGGSVTGKTAAVGYAEEDDRGSAYAASGQTSAYAMFTKAPLAKVYEPRWSVWASGFGGSQSTDGNALVGSNSTTSSIAGTAVGADYLLSPRTIAGFALAGGGTNFSVVNSGSGRSDLFQAGAYARHTEGNAYVTAALAYGWQDIITDRDVMVAGLDHLHAEFNANAFSGRVEGGYRFLAPVIGGVGITPYAAGQFTTFDLPAYAEGAVVGAPSFALNYAAHSVTDARSELGIRTDKSFATMNGGVLTLRSRFAWAHDFDPDRSVAATFQALPGASFVVNGASQASDSALTTASVEMKWMNGWAAAATFEGEFSQVTASYAGKGVVRYVW